MGQGALAKFCVDPVLPFDASSEPYEYVPPFGLKATQPIIDIGGVRGTRSHHAARSRKGAKSVGGDITLPVSALMLDKWLPRILGAAESTNAFAVAETLPEFQCMHDTVEKVFSYTGCKVSKATFKGSAGSPLILVTLSILALDRSTGDAGTFPVLTMPVEAPYLFNELVLTVDGDSREAEDFELTIDNMGSAMNINSFTASRINIRDRIVSLSFTNPFESDSADLLDPDLPGLAATLVWTPSGLNATTTITLPALQIPADDPTVQAKDQIPYKINAIARRTAGAAEIAITHNSAVA